MLGLLLYSLSLSSDPKETPKMYNLFTCRVPIHGTATLLLSLSQGSKTIKPDSPVPFIVDGNSLISAIGQDNWEWKNTVTSESFNNEIMMNYSQTFHLV